MRADPFPTIGAMSGRGHDEGVVKIGGESWTDEVFRICNAIDFLLQPHRHDGRRPRNSSACHAEKQLIAYFISKHAFLQDNFRGGRQLHDLFLARPPIGLRAATILVSSDVCFDCVNFGMKVEVALGLFSGLYVAATS